MSVGMMFGMHPGPVSFVVRVCECGFSVETHRDALPPDCSGWRPAGWGICEPGRPTTLLRRTA